MTHAAFLKPAPFLRSTRYCTTEHPVIVQATRAVVGEERCERARAMRLFEWVRDHVVYAVGNWNRRAWETVLAAEGTCSNKANVLVAMLRAADIPAGYGIMQVDATRYWGRAVPGWVCQGFSKSSIHVYVTCLLDGRWVKCDPSDDRALSENVGHLNTLSRLIEWDGKTDAVLPFEPEHIRSDEGMRASIDHLLSKEMKAHPAQIEMMNLMFRFARCSGLAFSDIPSIQAGFFAHVRSEAPELLERFYASFSAESIPAPPESSTRVSTRMHAARGP